MENGTYPRSCVDCGIYNCKNRTASYPEFCPTAGASAEMLDEVARLYTEDEENSRVAVASAEVEGEFYGRYTRVEEIMAFARKIGARKIGIATCVGLIEESRTFTKILRRNGFEVYGAVCKAGAMDKTDIGVDPQYTCQTGNAMCNPILQARLLNEAQTQLNVVVGLCVGHDSLFYKYADALCTTLITKDRVLGHNPAAALYQAKAYYKRLLNEPVVSWED